jgi:hypothetical protein
VYERWLRHVVGSCGIDRSGGHHNANDVVADDDGVGVEYDNNQCTRRDRRGSDYP